jgi:hypothetical protein
MLHMRPHNRFEDIDGMYLVGGGTHPGSGLPVIYSSARITSNLLLQDLGLPPTEGEPDMDINEPWADPACTPVEPVGSSQ